MDAPGPGSPDDALLQAMLARLSLAPGARALGDEGRLDALALELRPFIEVARRAEESEGEAREAQWREARSLAWLSAYRMADQGFAPSAASAVVLAWRDARGTPWARGAGDEVGALFFEGYARGREDRARTELLKSLSESLPVVEVAPGLVLVVAAGPLDSEGAGALADRASSLLLRSDARAVLLDLGGLVAPSSAVLTALWAVPAAARTLGAKMVVSGVHEDLGPLPESEGERRVPTLASGVDALLRDAGVTLGASGLVAWLKGLVTRGR